MNDNFSILCLAIIAIAVPSIGYLLPQDPAVVRLTTALSDRRRHRQLRRWVDQQRQPKGGAQQWTH